MQTLNIRPCSTALTQSAFISLFSRKLSVVAVTAAALSDSFVAKRFRFGCCEHLVGAEYVHAKLKLKLKLERFVWPLKFKVFYDIRHEKGNGK